MYLTKPISVYSEGIIHRSKKDPRVISGELPDITHIIIRSTWIRWKYWLEKVFDRWMGYLQHIPLVRYIVFEVYERHYYPILEPTTRQFIKIDKKDASDKWKWT